MTRLSRLPGSSERFVHRHGRLRYYAAKKAVVTVGAYDAEYQVCLIGFVKSTGAVFVDVPFYHGGGGVVASASITPTSTGGSHIDLGASGTTATLLVKYSHPPDGHAHFSRDGGVFTEVRRHSFPLHEIGNLFELHVFHPYTLDSFDPLARRTDRVYLRNRFTDRMPSGITVVGEWRRKDDMEASIERHDGIAGPQTKVLSKRSGVTAETFFFGQPPGYPLQDHVLLLSCGPSNPPPDVADTLLVFIGGLDSQEATVPPRNVVSNGCLTYMYPAADLDTMRQKLGTIDFTPLV